MSKRLEYIMTIKLYFKDVESDNLDRCFTWTIELLQLQVFSKEELLFCGAACETEALWTTWRVQGGFSLSGLWLCLQKQNEMKK